MLHSWHGVYGATPTPFNANTIDEQGYIRLLNFLAEGGLSGVVPAGSTGESLALSPLEVERLIDIAKEVLPASVKIILGTGTALFESTLALTQLAQRKKAQAAMVITPFYSRPNQEALLSYYRNLHDQTDIPLIIYSVPKRTGTDFTYDTLCRLGELPRIVGFKDASGDLTMPARLKCALGNQLALFCGDDDKTPAFYAQGGDGSISVTANVAPALCMALHKAWLDQNLKEFHAIRNRLLPLNIALFEEVNPAPVKYALSQILGFSAAMRIPSSPVSESLQKKITHLLKDLDYDENHCLPKQACAL